MDMGYAMENNSVKINSLKRKYLAYKTQMEAESDLIKLCEINLKLNDIASEIRRLSPSQEIALVEKKAELIQFGF
ncbi:MAG TPA: hypothetical protein VJK05_02805 [archaeon]|nr:hypothetical protein [archaeon]